ncbi:DUF1993 family protein [Blastomonas sp.]|uniref:DUF1993 domain-containing protein n=1 Tax=Blastomonas sp. TaxID=1909299 RepID=UPI003593121A
MKTSDLLITSFTQMLKGLSAQLGKAATHGEGNGIAADTLTAARLAPDMFPLHMQVRFSCHQVNDTVARLSGAPLPLLPECANDIAALQACIAETLAKLENADRDLIDGADDRMIDLALPNGMTFRLTAAQLVRDWAIPQFYFHLTTAYAILRTQGVPLGKPDYVSHMFAYLKAPAEPAAV